MVTKVINRVECTGDTTLYVGNKDVGELCDKLSNNLQTALEYFLTEDSKMENISIRIVSNGDDKVFLTQHNFSRLAGELVATSTGTLYNTNNGTQLYNRLATSSDLELGTFHSTFKE